MILYPGSRIGGPDFAAPALYFEKLSIFLAGGMKPDPWLTPFAERGIVGFSGSGKPFPPDLGKILDEYLRWGQSHSGSMKDLRGWADGQLDDRETTSQIKRQLKGPFEEREGGIDSESWKSHLILNLAQKLDESQNGLDDLLSRADASKKSFACALGIDEPEDAIPHPIARRPSGFAGHRMGERIEAWRFLFGEQLPLRGVLATIDRYAHEEIVEKWDGNVAMIGLGTLEVPVPSVPEKGRILEDREGWCLAPRSVVDRFIGDVLGASGEDKELLSRRFSAVAAEVEKVVRDTPPPSGLSGSARISFVFFQGLTPSEVLADPSRGSVPSSPESASLFLLVEQGEGR